MIRAVYVLNLSLRPIKGLTDGAIVVEDFVVEELREVHSRLVQNGLVLVDTYHMGHTDLKEDLSYFLRVTTGHVHKLKIGRFFL